MDSITRSDGKPMSRQEMIDALVAIGMNPVRAELVVKRKLGESVGDFVFVDSQAGSLGARTAPEGPQIDEPLE